MPLTLKEASDDVALSFEGDTKVRLIRTLLPPMRNARWSRHGQLRGPRSARREREDRRLEVGRAHSRRRT